MFLWQYVEKIIEAMVQCSKSKLLWLNKNKRIIAALLTVNAKHVFAL